MSIAGIKKSSALTHDFERPSVGGMSEVNPAIGQLIQLGLACGYQSVRFTVITSLTLTRFQDAIYIFDLLRRIVTVSMRTNEIVVGLPKLKF